MMPPEMAGWNLALRFLLELAALAGLATAAWSATDGVWRGIAAVAAVLAAAAVWGTFNVPDDPSRSGAAPVVVPGGVRLAVELSVLGGGGVALLSAGHRLVGAGLLGLVVVHYLASVPRIEWLLGR